MARQKTIWTSNLISRSCPLCGGLNFHVISCIMQHHLDLNTVICLACSFVFTNPLPEKSIYDKFYSESYADYYGHIASRPPNDSHGAIPEFIRRKINWISSISPLTGKRLVEVGPGQGLFLWCAQQSGADVIGIEPSKTFFETLTAHNIPSVFGSLEKYNSVTLGHFDFVVMFHVLEHFYDPNAALEQARELLINEGYLVLEVPNILKPFRSLDRYFLRYVHPSNFSSFTLDAFLQNHGFKIVFIDEGGNDWRTPQNLFVIAQKRNSNIQNTIPSQKWDEVVLHLKRHRTNWRYWGQYRWTFYEMYILFRRLFFRIGRLVKRTFLRDRT